MRSRRGNLADEIDVADVDAQLERGGRHHHLQLAAAQPLLGVQPHVLGEAAVVRRDALGAELLGQVERHALGEAPRVHHDERRAVRFDQLDQAVRRSPARPRPTSPLRAASPAPRSRDPCGAGGRDRRSKSPLRSPFAKGRGILPPQPTRNRATSSIGFCVAERPMRCRRRPQTWSRRSSESARCAPRRDSSTAWISSTMTTRAVRSISRERLRGQQQVERLRRGDEDVRRRAQHRGALGLRRVAAPHRRGDAHRRIAGLFGDAADLAARLGQVLVDVGGQRLQRRDVDRRAPRRAARRAPAPRAAARRSPSETRPASCPSRSARRSGCSRPGGSPASRPAAPRWAAGRRRRGLGEARFPPALDYGMEVGRQHRATTVERSILATAGREGQTRRKTRRRRSVCRGNFEKLRSRSTAFRSR